MEYLVVTSVKKAHSERNIATVMVEYDRIRGFVLYDYGVCTTPKFLWVR